MIKHMTWDNNPKEAYLEDGSIVLECLEDEILGDHIYAENIPRPYNNRFPDEGALSLSSQHQT